jgi:hypothetical protein
MSAAVSGVSVICGLLSGDGRDATETKKPPALSGGGFLVTLGLDYDARMHHAPGERRRARAEKVARAIEVMTRVQCRVRGCVSIGNPRLIKRDLSQRA